MKIPSILLAAALLLPGLAGAAKRPDTAKALVKYVTAPSAASIIRKHGLEEAK